MARKLMLLLFLVFLLVAGCTPAATPTLPPAVTPAAAPTRPVAPTPADPGVLADALLSCTFEGLFCDVALGEGHSQKDMGRWSDGTPVKPMLNDWEL